MSIYDPGAASLRLRGGPARAARFRPIDAEVSVAPRFSVLLALGVAAVLLQSTLLHGLALRGGQLSLVTILLVWTGLRCGVVAGGWLGLCCGLLEDALAGGAANILSATLVGFFSGTLANRFFSDSLPLFLSAIACATGIRFIAAYLYLEFIDGERALFVPMSHAFVWSALLNCAVGAVVLLALRAHSHWKMRLR
jgi:rod shape-determining protein MreD